MLTQGVCIPKIVSDYFHVCVLEWNLQCACPLLSNVQYCTVWDVFVWNYCPIAVINSSIGCDIFSVTCCLHECLPT